MIPQLFEHQKKIIQEDPKQCGLFLGTGSGKTRTALELAHGNILVVTLKHLRDGKTWENNATEFGITKPFKVISKEEWRRDWSILPYYDTVIFDECHVLLGAGPFHRYERIPGTRESRKLPKTSQLFDATVGYIKKHNPERYYLCSATAVTKPMHLWAIAKILGKKWDFFKFRDKYYFEYDRNRFVDKTTKSKNPNYESQARILRDRVIELTKGFGYVGKLSDWFDVPEQTHKIVYVPLSEGQKEAMREIDEGEADIQIKRAKKRTIENGVQYTKRTVAVSAKEKKLVDHTEYYLSEKTSYILERAQEFPKMLIFVNYTAQIDVLHKELRDAGYNVMLLTGATKDRKTFEKDANEAKECIVIAQASISAGYELPTFPCVIFASKSNKYLDYDQALGRVLRANALKKNLYIHLIVKGGSDEACHESIMAGQDFQEALTAQE